MPRVLPRATVRVAANQSQRLVPPSPAGPPTPSSVIKVQEMSPQPSAVFEQSVRVVLTCNETWNDRYGSQEQAESDYKRMVSLGFGACSISRWLH